MIPVQPYAETHRPDLSRGTPISRLAFAMGLGLALAGGLDWFLTNGPAYKAHAIAGLSGPLHRPGELEQAAILATARPVFLRAAEALRDQGYLASSPRQSLDLAAGSLAAGTVAMPDTPAGAIVVEAGGETGAGAAAAADAVAKAFIEIENGAAADYERRRLGDGGDVVQKLSDLASSAHRRLDAALANIDPAQRRAKAAALAIRAKTHYEAFVAMLASGSPPVGAQTGLPPSIAPLQANYLELKRQLVLAQRTMGQKYPGAATLENAMRLSAKKLQAEWERLTQAAKANWEHSRDAETSVTASSASSSPDAQQEASDASLAAKAADDALARSQAGAAPGAHLDPPYRLIAAAVPGSAAGLPFPLGHILAALSGLAVAYAILKVRAPAVRARRQLARWASPDDRLEHTPATLEAPFEPAMAPASTTIRELLDLLAHFSPRPGSPLTLFVGTLEDPATTAPAALELARIAAWTGRRVLLIEANRPRSRLAGAVAPNADPVVVDILGTLKAALPDQMARGLYVAPAVPGAARLAADLARDGDVSFIGDATEAFDLAIVDAGRAGSGVWEDWGEAADATIQVGRSGPGRDDHAFLSAAGTSLERFLGVISPDVSRPDEISESAPRSGRRKRPSALAYKERFENV